MSKEKEVLKEIKEESKDLAFSPMSERLVRLGYGARGLIFIIIGLLAIQVAIGTSGSLQDQQGALASIGHSLLGRIFLFIVLVGLIGYSLWGLIRAVFDPFRKGKDFKGLLKRSEYIGSAAAYAILIPPTYNFIFNNSGAAQNGAQAIQIKNIISTIFLIPLGKWIVGLIGLIVLGVSLYQVRKALRHNFAEQLKPYALTSKQIKLVKRLGRFGTLGRAVVVFIIGLFLLFAAYHSNTAQVRGIDGALLILLQQSYGHLILGIVAIGLLAFGCYSLLGAFWFKFKKQ